MKDISKTLDGKITGGHMLARALKHKGIERIFSLCGGFINPVTIGCLDYGIDIVSVRNEMEAGLIKKALFFTRSIMLNKFFLPNNLNFPKSRIILEN